MSLLDEEEQKILCYKYFENMRNVRISYMLGRSQAYCDKNKVNKLLLEVGESLFIGDIIIYGLED